VKKTKREKKRVLRGSGILAGLHAAIVEDIARRREPEATTKVHCRQEIRPIEEGAVRRRMLRLLLQTVGKHTAMGKRVRQKTRKEGGRRGALFPQSISRGMEEPHVRRESIHPTRRSENVGRC